jgi:MFS family permease
MEAPSPRRSLAQVLALNRTVAVVLASVLFFGLGEQLWSQFMPVYLEGATKAVQTHAVREGTVPWQGLFLVGAYAALRNFLEALCYVSGGRLTARLGDRGSMMLFACLTIGGYILFLSAGQWPVVAIVAALLILGWEPLSVPVTFTTVGSTVSVSGHGMAFALQSIQKRLPKILGPLIAGFVLQAMKERHGEVEGVGAGMRWLIGASLVLGMVSLALQFRFMPRGTFRETPSESSAREIVRNMDPVLKRLLIAEVFTRWCDWLNREFVVLYVVLVRGVSLAEFGVLVAVQNVTALLTYLPVGRLTRTAGLQPFVGVTFAFFALFPAVLALVPTTPIWLGLAFVVNGLREIGEPARKAMITTGMAAEVRARGVGLYWGIRALAMCPAALAGAGLWIAFGPQVLLYTAFAFGCVGAAVFYLMCRSASSHAA